MLRPARIPVMAIFAAVAEQAGVGVAEIRGPGQPAEGPANWPRQRAILLVRHLRPDLTLADLGEHLGGRGRSGINHMFQVARDRYYDSLREQAAVAEVLGRLGLSELPPYDPSSRRGRNLPGCKRPRPQSEARL
ncbi:hypothetical protein [Phenylobacterium sp.]|uniref:hypothetical protein n=1 Tax=Phenylobacterium sp. TaxID=1871053 RepID=UPI003918D84A